MREGGRLEFFSLGGALGFFWRSPAPLLPYIVAASVLSLLSCWDLFRGAGRVDFILLGLAGYELAFGLTEQENSGRSAGARATH
jgi:hypothetical protein